MIDDLSQYWARYWWKSLIPFLSDCLTREDKWNKKPDSISKSLCPFRDVKSFFRFFVELLASRVLTDIIILFICFFERAFFYATNLFVCLFWVWIAKRQLDITQPFSCVSSPQCRATAPPGRKYFADETTGPGRMFFKARSTRYIHGFLFWKKLLLLNG